MLEIGFAPDELRWHEAQKPLALIEFLIKLVTKPKQVVLDPFMGSGTTAFAAQNLERSFIGFEINPVYCQKANELLNNAPLQFGNTLANKNALSLFK